jgi:phosphatidylserine/phosphatidylglycerophosphate/cardiolipin synthase-like enzyme
VTPDAAHVPTASSGAYPLRPGNRVRPLVDGEPALGRIADAVEAARRSVWVTVAFIERTAELPGGRGTVFDLLDRAAARGVDVRVLFWHEPELDTILPGSHHFPARAAERAWLAARAARLLARWDHVPRFCHHQKSWIVDAGTPGEVAFVGGINLEQSSFVPPGHPPRADGETVHDLYLEIRGPAATDVHHNFVQRWNEASERAQSWGAWPDPAAAGDLPFPTRLSPPAGDVPVQITRTVRAGCYACGEPAPGGAPYAIAEGERSVHEQYVAAIAAARRTLYFEQQFLASVDVLAGISQALDRGVEVVFLLPGAPMAEVRRARNDPRYAAFFAHLATFRERKNFTLAGLVAADGGGRVQDVYVHAKALLVDDAWVTIGSANTAERSFVGDTELNASCWHAATARALRIELLREHLGRDTTGLDDRAALRHFREVALANRTRRARGERLEGLAVALDPATYAA